jgi:hypothetical protein
MSKVRSKVYLHNNYSMSELQEEYGFSENIADAVYSLLYEVEVIIEYDTETEEVKVVGMGSVRQ